MSLTIVTLRNRLTLAIVAALSIGGAAPNFGAAETTSEPVFRVAADTGAALTPAAVPVAAPAPAPAPTAAGGSSFDLTRAPEEHPLVPVVRALKKSQEHIDQNIRGYSCMLAKQERVEGTLGEKQYINMKVMHDPFSVYMAFVQPYSGREVAYVAGQNDGKLVVLEAGLKRYLGKMNLDPNGVIAMKDQKHPITRVGMRNLTTELARVFEGEMKYGECEVKHNTNAKIDDRPTTMFQIEHPVPRQAFRGHVVRIFFDNELLVPIHYDCFSWPAQAGGPPQLEESYTYQKLKINNGLTARDFDANNNPEIFKQ